MSLMREKMGFENSFAYSIPTEFQLTTSGQSCKPTFFIFINAVHHQKVTESGLGGWYLKGLLWWLSSKESSCSAGDTRDTGSAPGPGRSPGEGNGNSLQYACLEDPHGQRSLVGYSPWGCKELDTIMHSTDLFSL